jgi:hypothetical protein
MDGFRNELGKYLKDGWTIVSTATYSANEKELDVFERTFLLTIQNGTQVRVLGYTDFYGADDDMEQAFDESPYKANFVKILSGEG